ncbi:Hypothetical protein PHPALM_8880 [Phytophthora palmivora]|uniref:Uncharacterized protein n=1 Tax=Phytophthora palmivora TaxID=4796 RepID=A0A2P4Y8R3_9STRA|nr:Hypothetical protein PHPALM_8880 [Phytophthora palmivora]
MLNNVLELQSCPDTGSDRCLLSRMNLNELARLDNSVKLIPLSTPVIGNAVGGHEVEARDSVKILIRLRTAAGPQDDDEFIVGNNVLRSLGIDVDKQLEQLVGGKFSDEDPFDRDDDVFVLAMLPMQTSLKVLRNFWMKLSRMGFLENH